MLVAWNGGCTVANPGLDPHFLARRHDLIFNALISYIKGTEAGNVVYEKQTFDSENAIRDLHFAAGDAGGNSAILAGSDEEETLANLIVFFEDRIPKTERKRPSIGVRL